MMVNMNRPVFNLDLDLLRTFVAVADLKTFAAAAVAVCRTQSAVSQQMQRLEQLVGKELFARHGRNKLLTEHGNQLLGYARKILRFNDEVCSYMQSPQNVFDKLTLGVSEDAAEFWLPYLLERIATVFPHMAIDVHLSRHGRTLTEQERKQVDLLVTTSQPGPFLLDVLRISPTAWYCATDYQFRLHDEIPLVVLDGENYYRDIAIHYLEEAKRSWRIAYVSSTYVGVRAAVKAGLGIMVGPVDAKVPGLRMLGMRDILPALPDTHYSLCLGDSGNRELAQAIANILRAIDNPYLLPTDSEAKASLTDCPA